MDRIEKASWEEFAKEIRKKAKLISLGVVPDRYVGPFILELRDEVLERVKMYRRFRLARYAVPEHMIKAYEDARRRKRSTRYTINVFSI